MSGRNRYVGAPVERLEDLRLLRGRGQYANDLHLPGMLFAAVLRSAFAHGRIVAIDAAAALALPGVHAVITGADLPGPVPSIPLRIHPHDSIERFRQPVIATEIVRYVGEPVALVLADSPALAEDALDAIAVEIEPLPAAVPGGPVEPDTAITYTAIEGDAARAFTSAPYVRRAAFRVHRHAALFMEPRGLLSEWRADEGRLRVYGAAKVPFPNRAILAGMMGLPTSAVDLHELDVGGGFGARGEFYPEDFLVPFAARYVGRPVKWTEDRREHLMATNHARDVSCSLEIACSRDGTILALRGAADVDVGAYIRTNGSVGPRNIAQFAAGPYRIPNLRMAATVRISNKTPTGTYRGPGRFEIDFARERLFDMAANELGIDRVDFRRRNLLCPDELPRPLPAISPIAGPTDLDSGDYAETLERCLEEIGWAEKAALQGRLIDGRYHGLGIGCFIEGGGSGPSEDARLRVEADGSVTVLVGSSGIGQGLETIMAQIAADGLELPIDAFRVLHGSTVHVNEGHGSYHSRATVMGGSAVTLAAEKLVIRIREAAAQRFGCVPDLVTYAGGTAIGPNGHWATLADLAAAGLASEATFFNSKHTFAYGAQAAHVAVDPRTGHVEVVDYVSVEDVGRIINAMTVHGQAVGAVAQGLGGVFLEEIVHDEEGQLLTGSLADYLLPTATDFPVIRSVTLENYPSPNNLLGAKGAGEGGIIPVVGVIANAVAAALAPFGVEPNELPLSPPRVWEMIQVALAQPETI